MNFRYKFIFYGTFYLSLAMSCKKEKNGDILPQAGVKNVSYSVKGTHIKLNFIDSNSVFQSGKLYQDAFTYSFKKGSGAGIGISVFKQAPGDTIYSWSITIDGKLYANAFSEGGAYLSVPFN
ncbi:MAG: hypothetical protein ABJB11_12970 [Ferruginibacter sp.]